MQIFFNYIPGLKAQPELRGRRSALGNGFTKHVKAFQAAIAEARLRSLCSFLLKNHFPAIKCAPAATANTASIAINTSTRIFRLYVVTPKTSLRYLAHQPDRHSSNASTASATMDNTMKFALTNSVTASTVVNGCH